MAGFEVTLHGRFWVTPEGQKTNKVSDRDRFIQALRQIAGKRLTYDELTGKVGETSL